MKRLLLTATLLLPLSVGADPLCRTIHDAAKLVMSERQSEVSIIDIMESTDKMENKQGQGVVRALIRDAYRQPVYIRQQDKREIIKAFAEGAYLECAKAVK